ncbi:hypothetical protein QYE76_067233 [Lolium multiflorum]|uniref:Transposase (putative) gypsy type domain-containing protein n=1 Tax=Lolium multiflorum TaxID=4521 RepID=A0AAD8WAS4_LOLMU|nr:hypothetical protein QYE76_067233 [Lolium multiflorum]
MPPRPKLTRHNTPEAAMAVADLGATEWERSKISAQDINMLKKLGLSNKKDALRFPSEESYPTPPIEYRVSFVDHLIRGLSAPIHDFLRGLLFVYGLQLHHLTPNSILHISIFITLCECFLGVHPNWALWKRIFLLRRNGSPNIAYNIGGVVICVRPDVEYFDVKFPDSVQGWREKWLYVREECADSLEHNIPPFDGNEKIFHRRSWDAEATDEEKSVTEALMKRIHELQNTRGQELSGIQITAHFLRIRVQPLQARKKPLWMYAGDEDVDRISTDLSVKDLEKLVRKISCRVTPYSSANPLPKNHQVLVSLPPLPEGGEVDERTVVNDEHQVTSRPESEVVGSRKSAASSEKEVESEASESTHSLPSAVSPTNKQKGDDAADSGTSKNKSPLKETLPEEEDRPFNPYDDALVSSDDEERNPPIDVTARTSTSRTLVISEAHPKADETSPPQQDIGHPSPVVSPRAPSPKRARTDQGKELRKTHQDYDLESPEGDRLLDALSLLEIHGDEARQGIAGARIGLLRLWPYFFAKKKEPESFAVLAQHFIPKEDLGLGLRQEGLKIGVEGTIALVAESQQAIDWTKVGDVGQMETKKWQSMIKAAKPSSKKILSYLGCKPTPSPSSTKPEILVPSENTHDSPDDTSEGKGSSIPIDFHTMDQTDGSVRNVDADRDTFVDAAADGAKASPAKRSTGGFADEDDLFDIDEGFVEPPSKKAKSDAVSPVAVASEASAPKAAPMAQASIASSLSKVKDISPTAATAAPFSRQQHSIPVDALERVPNNSPSNAVSTILASHQLTQELLVKGKGALARMHSMIFPKIKQEKTLGQLIDTFAVDTKEVIEVFPVPSFVDDSSGALPESDRIQRMRDRMTQMEKDLRSTYALAAIINKKSEIAAVVERYILGELHKATESLNSCLPSIANATGDFEELYPKVLAPAHVIVDRLEEMSNVPEEKETPQG